MSEEEDQEDRERPMFGHICSWLMVPGVCCILFSIQRGRMSWMAGVPMLVVLVAMGITANFKWVPKRHQDSDSRIEGV